jgi:hypothetical protein
MEKVTIMARRGGELRRSVMEKRSAFLVGLLSLMLCSISSANITNVTAWGDGAFAYTNWSWSGNASEVPMSIHGNQLSAPGHLTINVLATDALDPTLKISNSIDNDTGFAWTQFKVNITMAVSFTLTNVAVTAPGDWTVFSFDQTANFTGSNYLATVVYDAGTPIAPLGSIDFGYWVQFSGSPSYIITQELIPVPEPGTLSLVAVSGILLGGFALGRRRRRA